jgi:hypothetical protein
MRIITILLLLGSICNAQNTVYLKVLNGKEGKGLLKSRGNEHFVITPKHVIAQATAISIIGDKKVKSNAKIEHQYADDIAILRIEGGGLQNTTSWRVEPNFTKIIENNISGFYVESREPDGNVVRTDVEIIAIGTEEIQIQRKDPNLTFMEGWSGSSLYISLNGKKIYLGMLTTMDERKAYIIRADYMSNIMKNFFGNEESDEEENDNLIENQYSKKTEVIRELESNQVKMVITKFEQNNNKAIFYFTLTNKNPAQQTVEFQTQLNYLQLQDQNGISYGATSIQIGNNNNRSELVTNVAIPCKVEFEVGMNKIKKASKLQLSGYNHEFKFFHVDLVKNVTEKPKEINNLKNKIIGSQSNKMVHLDVTGFEQNNNKVIFHFKLTNKNPTQQIIEFHTQLNYLKLIDQSGYSYVATNIQIGNSGNNTELINNVPVSCKAEFEVGMNIITKAAKLQLNGYNHQFIFLNLDLDMKKAINDNEVQKIKEIKPLNKPNLGSMELEKIKISLNKIEIMGSKTIIHYTYENTDKLNQSKIISTNNSYNKLKINGTEFQSNYVSLGSTENSAELIYPIPLTCFSEFEIGNLDIAKIESLTLGLYNYNFEFVGKGSISDPKFEFKSKKSIDTRNAIIFGGAALLLNAVTTKKKEADDKEKQKNSNNK